MVYVFGMGEMGGRLRYGKKRFLPREQDQRPRDGKDDKIYRILRD